MFDTETSFLRLRVAGLSARQADQIVRVVQKWVKCNGEEYAVDRLKCIKVDLLHWYAQIPIRPDARFWMRRTGAGIPKGEFRCLFRLSKKHFKTAWNAIMVYTGIYHASKSPLITERQRRKMLEAVRRQPVSADSLVKGVQVVHESPFRVDINVRSDTGNPLVDYQPSPSRRAPKGHKTVPEVQGILDSLRPLVEHSLWTTRNWDIISGTVRGIEKFVLEDLELNQEFEAKAGGLDDPDLPDMGVIALIQEGGMKLRFAANPYRVYQKVLEPLGDALFRALRSVPNDFTFDQTAALPRIQQWIKLGLPMCSMDITNCSDNLPLDLQLEALSLYGVGTRWLQVFKDTCRGRWSLWPRYLAWTVGSPLGLYPTFASFALLHHSMVQWCFKSVDGTKVDGVYPYAIVGDDVVMANRQAALLYRELMADLGVPISEHKTLWATGTAEFIGRVITKDRVVQGFKWKGRVSDENFVEFCRQFGPASLILLTARQRAVISYISDLPEPYGLGWNPLGIPLGERLTPAIEAAFARDERKRTFMRKSARFHRLAYNSTDFSGAPVAGRWADAEYLSSDQEDLELVRALLPGLEHLGVAILPNLQEVILARGETPVVKELYGAALRRTSYVETRKEAPNLVILERKVRRSLALSWRRNLLSE